MPHLFTTNQVTTTQDKNNTSIYSSSSSSSSASPISSINFLAYQFGCILFLFGSYYHLPKTHNGLVEDYLFLGGSIIFLGVSLYDYYNLYINTYSRGNKSSSSKGAFSNSNNEYGLYNNNKMMMSSPSSTTLSPLSSLLSSSEFTLESIACKLYIIGSLCFVWGGILYLPEFYNHEQGMWCFIYGSAAYAIGSLMDAISTTTSTSTGSSGMKMIPIPTFLYTLGSILFFVSSYLYVYEQSYVFSSRKHIYKFQAYSYIMGSICFFIGGLMHMHSNRIIGIPPKTTQKAAATTTTSITGGMQQQQQQLAYNPPPPPIMRQHSSPATSVTYGGSYDDFLESGGSGNNNDMRLQQSHYQLQQCHFRGGGARSKST